MRIALGIDRRATAARAQRIALCAFGVLSSPALAQDAGDDDLPVLETVTVTGSHVRRVDIETANPIITIDRATIEKSGRLTLGDLIQQLPVVTGPNINPQVNNGGGSGFTSIGLRGLGSQRTLLLINGHRFLASNPNDIPANMVERIEVLTDGASSVYGSDAVAGVVNFILRSEYQGAELAATYGISDHDDGARRGYQFTFGQGTDKGSIMAGISYNKQDQVLAAHRAFSKDAVSLYGTNGLSPYGQAYGQQVPRGSVGGSTSSPFGHIQTPDAFRDTFPCGYLARDRGTNGQNVATDYHCYVENGTSASPSDKYNFASVNLTMTPQERTSLYLNGNYKLAGGVEAYASVMHGKAASAFQLAPAVYSTRDGAIIAADSYYNPFHVDFATGALRFDARLSSLGTRRGTFGAEDDQVSTGLRGSFDAWRDQAWTWDAGFDYGHYTVANGTEGLPNVDLMNRSTGPSFYDPGTESVRCGTPDHPIDGCVPVNIFDLDDPHTIAVLRSAVAPAQSLFHAQERIVRADLHGGLAELPAGTMQLAFGAAYRQEYTRNAVDTSLELDPVTLTCTLGSQCGSPLQGGYSVREIYAELFAPLLKDAPFAHAMNLTIGARRSRYTTFGATTNAKVAIEWRPVEDLLARATVADVFRAPTVNDLFRGPGKTSSPLSHDPCDGYTGNPPNPACVNVPADGTFRNLDVAEGSEVAGVSAGAVYAGTPLAAETGRTFDIGLVYDPEAIDGLSTSADVWRIYLEHNIVNTDAQAVLDLCSEGRLSFCPLIHRYAGGIDAGQIQGIVEPVTNLGRTDARGFDVALRYRLPESSFGRLSVGINATYLGQYDVSTAPGSAANAVYHYAGHFMSLGSAQAVACAGASGGVCLFPRWRAQTTLDWQHGAFDASWHMRYIHRFRMGSPAPSQDIFPAGFCYYGDYCTIHGLFYDYGATVYHDVQIGYAIERWSARIDAGINDLADRQPPVFYSNNALNANTDPSDFDLLGRYYWCRLTVKF
ncbi:MAG TPA: TonB-dependent receptor [Rhodanobacteraceae bacterium]|nr:TonB-dependent receptor [Rhodanobacteraceae bacterium]